MKVFKRIIGVGLLFAVVLSVVACGSDSSDSDDTVDSDVAETASDSVSDSVSDEMSRLDRVKERGSVVCAGNNALSGFGFIDSGGNNVGFDIDLCRAVAAAVLGNANAIEVRPTPSSSSA